MAPSTSDDIALGARGRVTLTAGLKGFERLTPANAVRDVKNVATTRAINTVLKQNPMLDGSEQRRGARVYPLPERLCWVERQVSYANPLLRSISRLMFTKILQNLQITKRLMPRQALVWRHAAPFTHRHVPARQPNFVCGAVQRQQLGESDLSVSRLCLGTMLFGESTDEATAHRLLDVAAEHGITFFDSAEMYAIPQTAANQGLSEQILGRWLRKRRRSDFQVATKIAGPGGMDWLRCGPVALDSPNIAAAIDGSLLRLGIDCIDLIQLHWPDRYVPMFGDVEYDCSAAYPGIPFEEQLEVVATAITAGKVRHFGLSNETPYGVMKFCHAADMSGGALPRPVSLQNAYNLTCRTFDAGLAECCAQEAISLLAYSPLAMGLLTGKYLDPGGGPPEARLNKYKGRYAEAESRYGPKPNVREAVAGYVAIATRWGCSPAALALRFVLAHPLVGSVVVGATSEAQLLELIGAAEEEQGLEEELRAEIDAVHARYPNPTP